MLQDNNDNGTKPRHDPDPGQGAGTVGGTEEKEGAVPPAAADGTDAERSDGAAGGQSANEDDVGADAVDDADAVESVDKQDAVDVYDGGIAGDGRDANSGADTDHSDADYSNAVNDDAANPAGDGHAGGIAGDGRDADHDADDADNVDAEDADEPAASRKWLRNTIAVLLVMALIGNILALLPRIYNMDTLPLLAKSRELSAREEVRKAGEAVVLILTDRGRGSGFHVSGGYILTNHHVIEDAAYAIVEFSGSGARFPAEVVASDPDLDAAVLRADGGENLPFIEIEREWEPGDPVYVIGNPLYLEQIAGEGKIVGTAAFPGRRLPVMVVDAPVRRGNSGSPVINRHGRAIAVVYASGEIAHQGETVKAGFAVPLRDLDSLLRDWLPGY